MLAKDAQDAKLIKSDYLAGLNVSLSGYGNYIPAQQATAIEIATVKQQLSQR